MQIILEYDSQNISGSGLDFSRFIKLGGILYAYRDTALMHHKFALIDNRLLLTGSFNWTYNSNAENLVFTEAPELVSAFHQEFNRVKALSVQIRKIRPAEVKVFANYPLFRNTHFQLNDLRKRVSNGAPVWWVRLPRKMEGWEEHFSNHRLPFDSADVLQAYWTSFRRWDTELFDDWWSENLVPLKSVAARAQRSFMRRMRPGDLLLAATGRQQVLGLGVVQSDPQASPETAYSSYREVQWLRVFPDAPFQLPKPLPYGQVGKFRGSAMRLLQELFA